MNPRALRGRAHILREIRTWFSERGYLELQTPILVASPAMEEHLEAIPAADGFLHTSPELAMKCVLASGLCRIYQLTPCFRDDEVGRHHTREFTMLEWYRVGAGTADLMADTESLIAATCSVVGRPAPAFERIATAELLDPTLAPDIWFHRWVDEVEPSLPAACIVHDYPAWQAALARCRGDVADRFEVYLEGSELANAFAEELSSAEVERRWDRSDAIRRAAGKSPHPRDARFLAAVDRMPRCAGIALGVDRLVAALLQLDDIRQCQVTELRLSSRHRPPIPDP